MAVSISQKSPEHESSSVSKPFIPENLIADLPLGGWLPPFPPQKIGRRRLIPFSSSSRVPSRPYRNPGGPGAEPPARACGKADRSTCRPSYRVKNILLLSLAGGRPPGSLHDEDRDRAAEHLVKGEKKAMNGCSRYEERRFLHHHLSLSLEEGEVRRVFG
ncbi:hypothetical protein RJ40_00165 [Methanofollis aquaemaris]|uniref:Uncharacterized protein n=1 Tax=Methanofollis aquaemaris TaxID=126734 RepID=A0A8A3S0M9_9EURY|nr:hypothetical protein [Methanofollis aquaemaris]QSZ66025.1 hypothetical protein RJ40_00165 [Methanofollis aquaemaris]